MMLKTHNTNGNYQNRNEFATVLANAPKVTTASNLQELHDSAGVDDFCVDIGCKIADELCGFFIGAQGQNIRRLKAEAQCDISLEQYFYYSCFY